jgi:small subunit ribosomal protein S6
MSYYECTFIARQDLLKSQAEALAESYEKVLAEHKGKVVKKEYWGLRNLAYPIKKNKRGHYTFFNVEAPSEAIQEMERQMRFNEDVIRYLSVKVDTFEEGPSAVLRNQEREDHLREKFAREYSENTVEENGEANAS